MIIKCLTSILLLALFASCKGRPDSSRVYKSNHPDRLYRLRLNPAKGALECSTDDLLSIYADLMSYPSKMFTNCGTLYTDLDISHSQFKRANWL